MTDGGHFVPLPASTRAKQQYGWYVIIEIESGITCAAWVAIVERVKESGPENARYHIASSCKGCERKGMVHDELNAALSETYCDWPFWRPGIIALRGVFVTVTVRLKASFVHLSLIIGTNFPPAQTFSDTSFVLTSSNIISKV